jgi:hypothetical protein
MARRSTVANGAARAASLDSLAMDSKSSPGATPRSEARTPSYRASIFSSQPLAAKLVEAAHTLERELEMPVWFLVQRCDSYCSALDDEVWVAFLKNRTSLERGVPIALIIDSPGGMAKSAYQVATLFRRHCGSFVAVIPRYAKSAATLLTLGADTIFLGEYAELGPLDAQFLDADREAHASALDEGPSA